MTKEAVIHLGPPAAGGYDVELFELAAGAPISLGGPGVMPMTEAELTTLEKLLPGSTPPAELQRLGLDLYGKLKMVIGAPLDTLMNGDAARIYIDIDAAAPELRRVPWEIMWWQRNVGLGQVPTSVRQVHHLSRVFQPNWTAAGPPPRGPLRILIAIGVPPGSNIEADAEKEAIERAVQPTQRTVDIEPIRPTSLQELRDKIKDYLPNVLHFIGHGTSNPAELKFQGWTWTVNDISADVGGVNLENWAPNLVFLNACRSGQSSGELASIADAFLGRGASAAVAMQGDIRGKSAGELAGAFYEALAAGTPVSEALTRARGRLGLKEGAFPALTMRCSPAATLPAFQYLGDDYRERAKFCQWLPFLPVFVNQVSPRRDLCRYFWPVRPLDLRYRFVLLRGDSGFGKTLLGAWLLELGLRVGQRVRYIKVSEAKGKADYIGILRFIWEWTLPGQGSPLTDPLPPLKPELATALETSKDTALYGSFRQALAEATEKQPLTIVLDDFRKSMDHGSFWALWENLFVDIAGGKVMPNVNLVLVLGEDDYVEYKVEQEVKNRPQFKVQKEIRLRELDKAEFVTRFRDYLYFRVPAFRDAAFQTVIDLSAKSISEKEAKPLSVALFEEKANDLARSFSITLPDLS